MVVVVAVLVDIHVILMTSDLGFQPQP